MGLQWGEMGGDNLGDLFDFIVLLIIFHGVFWVLIIPKWLINDY